MPQRSGSRSAGGGARWPALAAGLLLVGAGVLLQTAGIADAALAHLILAMTAAALILHRLRAGSGGPEQAGSGGRLGPGAAWLAAFLAALAAVSGFLSPLGGALRPALADLAVALLALSLLTRVLGPRPLLQVLVPVLVLYVLVPVLPLLEAALSYPLRRLSAVLAAGLLSLGPGQVVLSGTEIAWGDLRVSVTSACSGLTLLQNLIWVAWWTVLLRHRGFAARFAHMLLVLPAVVAANTVRVLALALMAGIYGEHTLSGPAHGVIGWLAVVLAALLYLGMEHLFPATAARGSAPASGAGPASDTA